MAAAPRSRSLSCRPSLPGLFPFGSLQEVPMRWIQLFTVALVLSALPTARGDGPRDTDAIQGTWMASTAELGGKPLPEEARKSIRVTLKDGTYTLTAGKGPDRGTVKLGPAAKPRAMDVTGTEGPNKGKTFLAIYELEADTLKVCYDLSGKGRPSKFETKEGTRLFLVTYKRAKP